MSMLMLARACQLENCESDFGSIGGSTLTGLKYLSTHKHPVIESVPGVELVRGGQDRQVVTLGAPIVVEYVA